MSAFELFERLVDLRREEILAYQAWETDRDPRDDGAYHAARDARLAFEATHRWDDGYWDAYTAAASVA